MSSKINVSHIINEHFDTLKDDGSAKLSRSDLLTFVAIPFVIATGFAWFGIKLSDNLTALLVNLGSIMTALLLSVLVLVYDQNSKIKDSPDTTFKKIKLDIVNELYANISYAILVAITLVMVCFGHSVVAQNAIAGVDIGIYLTTPILVFMVLNLLLTILMIVKRIHALLNAENE